MQDAGIWLVVELLLPCRHPLFAVSRPKQHYGLVGSSSRVVLGTQTVTVERSLSHHSNLLGSVGVSHLRLSQDDIVIDSARC